VSDNSFSHQLTAEELLEVERILAEECGTPEPERVAASNGSAPCSAPAGRAVSAESFAGIRAERTRWLWDQRIPLGTATLLVGREKLGKSTLTAELAAQLSRGALTGDLTGEAAATLIVTFEDSAARTIKPRLMAAGADVSRVHLVTARRPDGADLVTLPSDVQRIGELAAETGARLVIVDPLSASLGADVDGHRDQDIRRALAPLVALAERQDLAVLALAHLNKSQGGDALSRVLGSRGLTAAVRSVLTFGRAPDAEEGSPERVLAHPASNLALEAPSLAYRHEGREVHGDDGDTIPTNRLVLLGECDTRADELIVTRSNEERTATDGAAEWLEDELADGEWRAGHEVKAKAKAAGHSEKALRAARERLEIEYQRAGLATAGRGQSEWRLPLMPSPSRAEGTSAEGTSAGTRIPEPKTAGSGSAHALSLTEGMSEPELPLATAAEEAEVERIRAKFSDPPAEPEVDVAAVEEKLAREEAERVADALPAPTCRCDDPLVSDGWCAFCGKAWER